MKHDCTCSTHAPIREKEKQEDNLHNLLVELRRRGWETPELIEHEALLRATHGMIYPGSGVTK